MNQVVDRDSLESYIEKTMGDLSRPGNSPALHRKLSEILHQATQILKVLQWSEESQTWYFEVAQSKSEFGRTYQKGINLQIVPENLRIAALGDICSIDIENSVWQYYHHLGEALGLNVPLQLMYLLGDKKRFRRSLAAKVYPGMKLDDDSPEIKYVQRALTVIGFGGTARDIPGVRTGVKQCIMNDDARQRFFASDEVREIQGFVDNLLSALKKEYGNSNQFKGQSRWRKYLAYQYQQFESKLREAMVSQLHDMGMVVLLQVHDGVYAWGDRKPVDIKCAMSRVLESEYGGRSYKVGEGPRCEVRQFKTHKDLEAFWAEVEREEREHKERIKAEERAAKERMRAKRAEAGNRIADTGPLMPAYDDGRESAAVAQARNRILEDNMLREMQRAELEQWKEFL